MRNETGEYKSHSPCRKDLPFLVSSSQETAESYQIRPNRLHAGTPKCCQVNRALYTGTPYSYHTNRCSKMLPDLQVCCEEIPTRYEEREIRNYHND
jgi:hypothetical protein